MTAKDRELELIAYLLGDLDEAKADALQQELAGSEALRKELDRINAVIHGVDTMETKQPSTKLGDRFYTMLDAAQTAPPAPKRRNLRALYSVAAVLLVLVGVFIGVRVANNPSGASEALEVAKAAMTELLQESSTSKRLEAVNLSYDVESADQEILNILFEVLRKDESTSVRLAAIDALSRFIGHENVMVEMAASLAYQDEPAVQIALINVLSQLETEEAIPELERIIENDETNKIVRDQARMGLVRLL